MSRTLFFFDTETTGLDPNRHGIVQIAWIIEKPGFPLIERCFDVKLDDNVDINLKALEVNGFTLERLKKGQPKELVLSELHSDLNETMKGGYEIIPCGQNVKFDVDFLMAMIQKTDHKYEINFGDRSKLQLRKPVCTLLMAHFLSFHGKLNLPNYKNVTMAKHFGVPLPNAHDALGDVHATKQVYHCLEAMLLNTSHNS